MKGGRTTRFQPGRSGNPSGRPRKPRPQAGSAFDVVIDRTFTLSSNGEHRELSAEEALQQRIYQDALAGSRMAIRTVLKWIAPRDTARAAQKPARQPIAMLYEASDPRNLDEALLLLGIATEELPAVEPAQYRKLLLEPWAVQLALSRRGSSALTSQDRDTANRCTRDPQTLRWPGEAPQ